jgi:hypothetical protein
MHWTGKAGRKPNWQEMKEAATVCRIGTKNCLVIAMGLRPEGVTQKEVIAALGHPHRNKIRELSEKMVVRVVPLPDLGRSSRFRLVKR